MFNRVIAAKTDAIVFNRDGACVFVKAHTNFQFTVVLEKTGIVDGFKAQFVASIRGIGHQLAKKNFLVGIQGMNHQMQKLLHFRLKTHCFLHCTHVIAPFIFLVWMSEMWGQSSGFQDEKKGPKGPFFN